MDSMEIDGFICNFCHKLRHTEELHSKCKDGRLQCDKCYTNRQDVLNEIVRASQDMGMYD